MNQHQRDLKTNELEKLVTQAAPFLDQHKDKLIYGACAIMLAFSAWYYLTQTTSNTNAAGWSKFISADDSDEYGTVASQHKGEAPGQWALLNESDILLNQGVRGMFTDREAALDDLKAAEESYSELLNQSGLSASIEERALFGLARCRESLSGKDTSAAVKAYEELLRRFPDTLYAEISNEQIAALKAPENQEFYAWFQEQDPKPLPPSKPADGLPPGHPSVDPGSLIRLPQTPSMLKLPESAAPAFPDDAAGSEDAGGIPDPPPVPEKTGKTEGTAPSLPDDPAPGTKPTPEKSDEE